MESQLHKPLLFGTYFYDLGGILIIAKKTKETSLKDSLVKGRVAE